VAGAALTAALALGSVAAARTSATTSVTAQPAAGNVLLYQVVLDLTYAESQPDGDPAADGPIIAALTDLAHIALTDVTPAQDQQATNDLNLIECSRRSRAVALSQYPPEGHAEPWSAMRIIGMWRRSGLCTLREQLELTSVTHLDAQS
jgi:hypothetical protein